MRSKHLDGGFTLIELMVTVACIAVLAAVAVPRLQGYVLEARLNGAKPYLMEIAARQRMYKVETGKYCCTGYGGTDEDALISSLPVSIAEAGDFCFVFVCKSTELCEGSPATSGSLNFADGAGTPEFEVWAVLRPRGGALSIATRNSAFCQPATGKAAATGWVRDGDSAGGAGRIAVLRYPPPTIGLATMDASFRPIRLDWRDGVSLTDALQP